jgi:hypothetical protein
LDIRKSTASSTVLGKWGWRRSRSGIQCLKTASREGRDQRRYTKHFVFLACQTHETRDPNQKPFKHLEAFCKKEGIYRPAFLGVIEDAIGRTFDSEYDLLNDEKDRLSIAFVGLDWHNSIAESGHDK